MSNVTPEEIEDDALARALDRSEGSRDEAIEASTSERSQMEARADNVVPFVPRSHAAEPAKPAPAKPHDPGSSRFWWIPGGMLATAAAAIVMWWVWPPSEDVRQLDGDAAVISTHEASLPGYVLETDGGLEQLRGDDEGEQDPDDARHRYRRGTPFEWVLRPKADIEDSVAVRAFAFVDGGSAGLSLPIESLAEVAPTGVIRIAGQIAALNLEPGRYTIALAVGWPEELPTRAAAVAEAQAETAWVVRRVDVVIEE